MKAALRPRRGHASYPVWCLIFACLVVGCGGPRRVQVTGTVRFNGKPLPDGRVSFFSPDNQVESAFLESDGTYKMVRAVTGLNKVTVQTPGRPPGPPYDVPKKGGLLHTERPASQNVPLPKRYADPDTSGLTCNVEKDGQVYDIHLEP
jgi:hypothetical protein